MPLNSSSQTTEEGTRNNEIKRVRLDVTLPLGYTRHLLLGFTPDNSASDDFDYGYDAPNIENFPDDASWIIAGDPYVIQGVGAFDDSKKYPLGIFLTNSGIISFSLLALENFEQPIGIYIYDSHEDYYYKINEFSYDLSLEGYDHFDRFYIAFKDHNAADSNLSTTDYDLNSLKINYHRSNSNLRISSNSPINIQKVSVFDLLGNLIFSSKYGSNNSISDYVKLPTSQVVLLKVETSAGTKSFRVLF